MCKVLCPTPYPKLCIWDVNQVCICVASDLDPPGQNRVFHSYWYYFICPKVLMVSDFRKRNFPVSKKVVVTWRTVVTMLLLYSCNLSLGEILFSVKFASGFICICYSSPMNEYTEFCFLSISLKKRLNYKYKDVFIALFAIVKNMRITLNYNL